MIRRIVEISSGPTRLRIAHCQLVIERDGQPDATVPCEDVGVLIVDHPAATYTHGVFTSLVDAGAAIVLCGRDHHPNGLVLPLTGNVVQSERYRAQLHASLPLTKRLWKKIVMGKLAQQALVLRHLTFEDEGIAALSRRVRSGDPDNLEAQAAQRYWPKLLGREFRRDRNGAPPNNLLNYGYMALRAATARAICGAGLMATVGLHHRNRYNAFCLADDLMEPYRPYVDLKVAGLARSGFVASDIDRDAKRQILSVFNEIIAIDDRHTPLMLALHHTASSLVGSFESGEVQIALPRELPRSEQSDDAGTG